MIPLCVSWALAQDMAAPEVGSVEIASVNLPMGAPTHVSARPGDALQPIVDRLTPGSTLTLDPGRYAGPLRIDRPLSVQAEGAVITGPGRGTVLLVLADDVSVRGLEVEGGGRDAHEGDAGILVVGDRARLSGLSVHDVLIGIDLREANDAVIENSKVQGPLDGPMGARGDGIRLWESYRNTIRGNHLDHVRDMVVWYSGHNLFVDNRVENARYGVHFMHADDNRVVNNHFVDNVVGAFVMYSTDIYLRHNVLAGANGAAGMGFGCKESDRVTMQDNRVLGNTTGFYLDACPHRIDGQASIQGNLLAYNHAGIRFHQVKPGIDIGDNDLYENGAPVVVDGGGDATLARFRQNRWSEYEGYDLDGDDVGDLPYAPALASRGLVQKRPVATFFAGSPAAMLLDFLGTAFPMLAPRPLFSDPEPRMGRT